MGIGKINKRLNRLRLAAFVMAAVCVLCGIAHSEEDPVAVRVGNVTYTASIVQNAYISTLAGARLQNEDVDSQAVLDDTIERFVRLGLVENKLIELGNNSFSEEEVARLKTYAQQQYEQTWQELLRQITESGQAADEAQITEFLERQGYNLDAVYRECFVTARYARIIDIYCKDIVASDEEAEEYYTANFVNPDRERYSKNIPLFEDEILLTGGEAFYMPEGYRYMKHIVLEYPAEVQEELDALDVQVADSNKRLEEAHARIADTVLEEGDIDAAKAAYSAVKDELEGYVVKAEEIAAKAIPLLEDTISKIRSRYAAGESFETLMLDYSIDTLHEGVSDPGYLIHRESKSWPKRVIEAVFGIEEPGGISEPVISSAGVSIVKYVKAAPSGRQELNAQEYSALLQTVRELKQFDSLESFISLWKTRYTIETFPELIALR